MANVLRSPTIYRLPALPTKVAVQSQPENPNSRLLTLIPSVVDPMPFIQTDWPVPDGRKPSIDLRTWADPLKYQLQGLDVMLGLPGEVQCYDWQLPQRQTPNVLLKTQTGNLASSGLFTPPGDPKRQTDWPVPQGRIAAVALRTWLDPLKLNLLSQDQFYGDAGQPPEQRDFPVPHGRTPSIVLRTWTDSLKLNLLAQDSLPPRQTDFPVPLWRQPAISLLTHVEALKTLLIGQDVFYAGVGQAPEQRDWPVPSGRVPAASLRTHVQSLDLARLGSDTFFGDPGMVSTYDQPNPLGRQPAIVLRTHVQSLNVLAGLDKFFGAAGEAPHYDHPNPLERPHNKDLRTHLHRTDVQLIGQDQFFAAPGEAPRYDYPNPSRPAYPTQLLKASALYVPAIYPPIAFASLVVMALGCYNPQMVMGYFDPDVHSPPGP